jgi:hypothetical protein
MPDLIEHQEEKRGSVRARSVLNRGWGRFTIALAALLLVSGCIDLPTGFEPHWCPEQERAPVLGNPYHEWPDRYIVRFQPDVDPDVVAPELGENFGFEIRHLYNFGTFVGFSAHIPSRAIPLIQCDPRVEQMTFVGPPLRPASEASRDIRH